MSLTTILSLSIQKYDMMIQSAFIIQMVNYILF